MYARHCYVCGVWSCLDDLLFAFFLYFSFQFEGLFGFGFLFVNVDKGGDKYECGVGIPYVWPMNTDRK